MVFPSLCSCVPSPSCGARVSPVPHPQAAVFRRHSTENLGTSTSLVSCRKGALLSFASSSPLPIPPEAVAVVVHSIAVTFTALPVRRHLGNPLRMALHLHQGPIMYSRKVPAEHGGGLATASWGEGWALGGIDSDPECAVLRLELQAVGLFRSTVLSFMSINLSELPVNTSLQHTIDFGFGTLTAQLQL
eukprot:RCo017073